tara:strand:+ start:153916 stop:154203 length:288 start_codon:yes stop_codon:yes gene_type:complete
MATKQATLHAAKRIVIDCERNDDVDIRCGGPAVLGFDFLVPFEEKTPDLRKWLQATLSKHDRPVMSISISRSKEWVVKGRLWGKRRMEACIKSGY